MNTNSCGSKWRKWDLHVQTILDETYESIESYWSELKLHYPDKCNELINLIGSEDLIKKYDSKRYFFTDSSDSEKERAKNYSKLLLSYLNVFGENIGAICITDHNYDHPYLLDSLIKASEDFDIKIIPGVEINIQGVHALILFGSLCYGKQSYSDSIRTFLTKINIINKVTNNSLSVCSESYTVVVNEVEKIGAMLIYPHCNTSNGLFQERGKTDRTHLADHFNFKKINILQTKDKDSADKIISFIKNKTELRSKYVFTLGTDARSLKNICTPDSAGNYCWIKSDSTFAGLQQILVEPEERVHIGGVKPDQKELYKIIRKIKFKGTKDFPEEIEFNDNLCSIIGSRSSGKSALLNYIAHAVNPAYSESELKGPAANKSWGDLDFEHSVEWGDGGTNNAGNVIFLPQNHLFNISSKPHEITEKIKPVLFRKFPEIQSKYEGTINLLSSTNKVIEDSVKNWFAAKDKWKILEEEIRNIGEKKAIELAKKNYQKQVDDIKSKLSLTSKNVSDYQTISQSISRDEESLRLNKGILASIISQYINSNSGASVNISVNITFNPSLNNLPTELQEQINKATTEVGGKLSTNLASLITTYTITLSERINALYTRITKIRKDNKGLIDKHGQYEQLTKLVDELNKQTALLDKISQLEAAALLIKDASEKELITISENLTLRETAFRELEQTFKGLNQSGNDIVFGVEYSFTKHETVELSEKFNLKEIKDNEYIDDGIIDIQKVRTNTIKFLQDLYNRTIKLKTHGNALEVALNSLQFTEEVRFFALMEGDSIGGFSESSMTPGKQALFALSLILDESNDAWPLLIDQPEDDLDSRSIYDHIVPYLKQKKKERQIIMVSHNANLVIGADSEQIIVANKHGDDRKNINNQMFDYYSGSIECTRPRTAHKHVLEACGIREHACDILDGGEEAFEKRKNKYRI